MDLDKWQREVLATEGNICICSGRQVGKSTVVSHKAGDYAITNPKKTILVIAATERQSLLLFEKILNYIFDNYKEQIKGKSDKPTKHTIKLKNGSIIHCLPTGLDGYGIRGYTIDLLIADEAHFIPDAVYSAVTPMLATTGGNIILLSTPKGSTGYFRDCFNNPQFTHFHISSEDCPRITKEFLSSEKERMSFLQYAQEYLGQFLDNLKQFFPDKLIRACMIAKRPTSFKLSTYFLGVDVAALGEDESTFEILERTLTPLGEIKLSHIENFTTTKTRTTETTNKILELDKVYDFRRIYIDDGGLGVGVFDQLLTTDQTKRKIEAINNSRRSLDRDDTRKKKLMKEDLYFNLRRLMERGDIELLEDDEIMLSLKSIQYEYDEQNRLKIFGNYSHITEGLIRAAWCVKDKGLNIWIY